MLRYREPDWITPETTNNNKIRAVACVCMHMSMYVRMYVCMYIWMYVRMYLGVFTHGKTNKQPQVVLGILT